MPKAKNKSDKSKEEQDSDDSEWETVNCRNRPQGQSTDKQHPTPDQSRSRSSPDRSRSPPTGKGSAKPERPAKLEGKEAKSPPRSDSLVGKRTWKSATPPTSKTGQKGTANLISKPSSHHSSSDSEYHIPKKIHKTTLTTSTSSTSSSPQTKIPPSSSINCADDVEIDETTRNTTNVHTQQTKYNTHAQAAKKSQLEFKKPLPIPEWKDLELRIYKTNYKKTPITHTEFTYLHQQVYKYIYQYLDTNNTETATKQTEASHNQWSAALNCGIWECDNEEALLWHKVAITTATNTEYRAWGKNDKASNTIKIFPHESFAQFTPQEFLKSVAFYHRDLRIKDWEVLEEYCQKRC
jgi:hypothetical protein